MPVMPTAAGFSLKRPIQCVLKGNLASVGSVLSVSLPAGGPVRSVASEQVAGGLVPPPPVPAPAAGDVPALPLLPPPLGLSPPVPLPAALALLPPVCVVVPAAPAVGVLVCPPVVVAGCSGPALLPQAASKHPVTSTSHAARPEPKGRVTLR